MDNNILLLIITALIQQLCSQKSIEQSVTFTYRWYPEIMQHLKIVQGHFDLNKTKKLGLELGRYVTLNVISIVHIFMIISCHMIQRNLYQVGIEIIRDWNIKYEILLVKYECKCCMSWFDIWQQTWRGKCVCNVNIPSNCIFFSGRNIKIDTILHKLLFPTTAAGISNFFAHKQVKFLYVRTGVVEAYQFLVLVYRLQLTLEK